MHPFPSIWNGLSVGGGGGGGSSDSFSIIATDAGTFPTASSPTDILTLTTTDTLKTFFEGDETTDTIYLNVANLWNKAGDEYSGYHSTTSREWFQIPFGRLGDITNNPTADYGHLRVFTDDPVSVKYFNQDSSWTRLVDEYDGQTFLRVDGANVMQNVLGVNVSNTGAAATSNLQLSPYWNTSGTPNVIQVDLTEVTSNINSNIFLYRRSGVSRVSLNKSGSLNLDMAGAGTASITVGYDGGFVFTGGIGHIKRNTTLSLGIEYLIANSYVNGHIRRPSANWTTTSGAVYLGRDIGTFSPTSGTATFTNLSIEQVINQTGGANGITRGIHINPTLTAAADFRALDIAAGKIFYAATNTAGGTTGAQTINKISGTVNFAAAATTLVVTNNLVTTASIIFCVVRTNDATATIKNVVPAAGSFTITLGAAATAETSVGFMVIN